VIYSDGTVIMIWGHGVAAGFRRLSDDSLKEGARNSICFYGADRELHWRSLNGVARVEYSGFRFPDTIVRGTQHSVQVIPRQESFCGPALARLIAVRAQLLAA
jgi:hypothetical protein